VRSSIRRPRRVPVAKASEDIVTAIIDAGVELLSEGGIEALTTNHVAARAGVSVGSVYRYFADKLAILAEIDRRHRRDLGDRVLAMFETDGDLETVLRRAMESFVLVGNTTTKLRTVLMREVPPGWVANTADDIWRTVHERAAGALARHMPSLPLEVAAQRAFIALHAAQGVIMGHALWNPSVLHTRGPELVDEMLRLAVGYLRGPSTAPTA
jgi:AcrR family transcriptional regulator